jgi:tRNA(Arg) A34 adenosine deaminase TadA
MSKQTIDSGRGDKKRDPDLAAAEIAMKRAAAKARQKAKQVGAGVVLWKDGQVVEERQNSSADE